jgi:hypothetical protein
LWVIDWTVYTQNVWKFQHSRATRIKLESNVQVGDSNLSSLRIYLYLCVRGRYRNITNDQFNWMTIQKVEPHRPIPSTYLQTISSLFPFSASRPERPWYFSLAIALVPEQEVNWSDDVKFSNFASIVGPTD